MNNNKYMNIKTLGIGALCAVSAAVFDVERVTPPSIADCEAAFEQRDRVFRQRYGYDLTDDQRREVLKNMGTRRVCIDDAKEGPYPALALRHFGR